MKTQEADHVKYILNPNSEVPDKLTSHISGVPVNRLNRAIIILMLCLFYVQVHAAGLPKISQNIGGFPLSQATIYTDSGDFKVVDIAARMLAEDIGRVTGQAAPEQPATSLKELAESVPGIIAGTVGHSRLIDELIKRGIINVDDIKGKWESFIIETVDIDGTPVLVIAGSDRRATAFGLTSMSRAIGVSPWYWWADVATRHKDCLYVEPGRFVQGEPSVQYRGIFINDERFGGWANWVEKNFDKESGEVGPKVYEKVFELLLRLKGNYLWPAMHNGSKAFNANPENARLADDYAIVMGSSHCEQMLRNNEDEWKNAGTYGDFNYITNRKTMQDYWEARIKTNGDYENTYTLGLRGIHDYPMEGASTTAERTRLMQQAINDQRDILKRNINRPLDEIPQVLCTYEEVLDAYQHGLEVPDDVTLLWCDDKHGYTRNLCNPAESERKGGSGIYYHLSYHGDPASWIWLSPLSPTFISNELTKAYTHGVKKIWIFNVGDIKPAEKELTFVMDLGWDIGSRTPVNAHGFIRQWAAETFGEEYADEIAEIQDGYYRLQASGKDSHVYFVNYPENEIDDRLSEYRRLAERAVALESRIPENLRSACFELIVYPVKGAAMINEYQLLSRLSLAKASAGDSVAALKHADRVKMVFHELNRWTDRYNKEIENGKWDNFFCWRPYHWYYSEAMDAPVATPELLQQAKKSPFPRFLPVKEALSPAGAAIEAECDAEIPLWIEALTPVHNFSKSREDNTFCRVNVGEDSFEAAATPINNVWHALHIGPMWSNVGTLKLKKGVNHLSISEVSPGARIDSIFMGLYPPFPGSPGAVLKAGDYVSCGNSRDGSVVLVDGLGYNDGLEVIPFDTPSYDKSDIGSAPYADYSICLNPGVNEIEIRTLPTLHIYEGRDARYAVKLGEDTPEVFSIHAEDFSPEWRWNVLRGYASRILKFDAGEGGNKNLRFYFLDPGIVLQEIRVSATDRSRQILNGDDWSFGQARLSERYPAVVPGVVHTDLMANGVIEDPFIGLNERDVQWVDKEDWVYEKEFVPDPELLAQENVEIVFDGLDTYADVFLNDTPVISADNMFRTWKKDVKPYLRKGKNTLRVLLHSPIAADMPKWEAFPNQYRASNDQSENGGVMDRKLSVFARKAGYHYGWDWGPRLVTSGIWRDVYLEGWSDACIRNVYVRQHDVTSGSASISDEVEIEADRDMKDVLVSVSDGETGQVYASRRCDLHRGLNRIAVDFKIDNPRLWWCHNLGKPELYTFTTTVRFPGGKELSHSERVGLRSVEIVTEPDAEGTMQFYFVLNGVPVFAKGTNYIPQDNFLPRVSRERYESAVKDAVAANMNMIRVWGGGIYEDDIFYDLCDESGIMVWQDFMFACSMYPATGHWLENMKMEARDNLIRLRNHPSVVLWCGGNECLDAWYNWGWKGQHEKISPEQADRMEEEMKTQYFEALPEMVSLYAPDSFYWPNSPFSGYDKGSDGVNGDRHYYGVWQRKHPISQYNHEKSHFFSEYGVQSFPQYSTVLSYAPDSTTHSLDSDVMMWHQRGGEKANSLIAWYLENEYRKPRDFKEMLYMNQVFQADAMRTAIESHRRNMPHCMGSLLWQHDDCWPVASWSTRDYYGNWKAAHYLTRRAFENIIVSSELEGDSLHAYIISDLVKDHPGQLSATLYSLDGEKIKNEAIPVTVVGNTSSKVWSVAVSDLLQGEDIRDVVLNLEITADGHTYDGNFFFCRQSELNLPEPEIQYDIVPDDGGYLVKLNSRDFVRALCLSVDGEEEQFDDNYFDLLPGKPAICKVKSSLAPQDFKSRLKMRSLYH